MSNKLVLNEDDDLEKLEQKLATLQQRYHDLSEALNQTTDRDDNLEKLEQKLAILQQLYHILNEALNQTTDEDEILKYKSEIKKLKEEDIPHIQNKIDSLIQKPRDKQKQEKTRQKKEKLFHELHVKYDNEVLRELCNYFSLYDSSITSNLKVIVDKYLSEEIFRTVMQIESELKEEKDRKNFYDDLYATLTDHEIALFAKKYPIPCIRPKVIEYLVDNFSKDEIDKILTELYQQEENEKRKAEELAEQEQKEAEEKAKQLREKEQKEAEIKAKQLKEKQKRKEYRDTTRHLKRCPNCHKMVHKRVKKCPMCNYYFKITGKKKTNEYQFIKYEIEYKNCPVCGKEIETRAVRCKYCKTMLKKYSSTKIKNQHEIKNKEDKETNMEKLIRIYGLIFCPNCGNELPKIANECYKCGTKLS